MNCSSSVQFECAATEICLIRLCQLTSYLHHNVWSICLVRARLSFQWGGHLDWGDFGDVESSCASSKRRHREEEIPFGEQKHIVRPSYLGSCQHSIPRCTAILSSDGICWARPISPLDQLWWDQSLAGLSISAPYQPLTVYTVHCSVSALSPISAPHLSIRPIKPFLHSNELWVSSEFILDDQSSMINQPESNKSTMFWASS